MDRVFRIVGFALAVILVIIAIFAIVRAVSPDESPETRQEEQTETTPQATELSATASSTSLSIRGPVINRENSYRLTITITPDRRALLAYRGDQASPIISESLSNDSASYREFIGALSHNNVNDGITSDIDPRGYCDRKELYELTYKDFSQEISKWGNNCDREGNLDNERSIVRLFKNQIPEFEDLVEVTGLD